jgi:hypothetical protein
MSRFDMICDGIAAAGIVFFPVFFLLAAQLF